MNKHDVDQRYREGHFKEGHSRKADEAIARLMDVLRPPEGRDHFSGTDFEAAWQELLETLMSEFPDISLYNLVGLGLPLIARGLHQENLVIYRLAVELGPPSSENQCFLGHAYRDVGDLESAAACYKYAYELAMRRIAGSELEPSHPECLDACDYLCYLAKVENDLRRRADALVHATQALAILNKADAVFKKGKVYELLHQICVGMNLSHLAERYRLQAVK